MSKFMMLGSALLALSLMACGPNPAGSGTTPGTGANTGTTTGTGSNTGSGSSATGTASIMASKATYIAFLNCAKSKSELSADAKAAIDTQIAALNLVPDSTWATISANYSASLQTTYAAALASCSTAK